MFIFRTAGARIDTHVEYIATMYKIYHAYVTIEASTYQDCGVDSGNGLWLPSFGPSSRVAVRGQQLFTISPDKLYTGSDAPLDLDGAYIALTENDNPPSTHSSGMWKQIGESGNAIDVGAYNRIFCNASANTITTLTTKHSIGKQFCVEAFGGTLTFGTGGNILLANSPLIVPEKGIVTFERIDTIGTHAVVAKSWADGNIATGSTDNAVLRADGTGGKTTQSSQVTISDTGIVSGAAGNQLDAKTDSYTLVLGDAGKTITLNKATAVTLTVPANASVAFPVGTIINIAQLGAGQVTVSVTSDTLRSSGSKTKLTGQYSGGTLTKIASTQWLLTGDIAA